MAIVFFSGCINSVPTRASKNQTTPIDPTIPTVSISPSIITTSFPVITPQKISTLGPLKTIKDSDLWFTMQVPASWEVKTEPIPIPEGYVGIIYETYLFEPQEFYIITYAISRDFDQSVRNRYRNTLPQLLNESTVTINRIIFDRFEWKTEKIVKVAYVVRKGSANERGFASVILYTVNSSSQYQQKDFESFISTFKYETPEDIKSAVGEETKKVQ